MDVLKTVGALAGLGAFAGVSILAVLYFSQARDVRRLRDWAGRAPERAAAAEDALAAYESGADVQVPPTEHERGQAPLTPAPVPAQAGAPVGPPSGQRGPMRPPEDWQIEAEEAAAAELDERRQQREDDLATYGRRSMPQVGSPLIVIAGGLILLFAIVFGATQILGGGGGTETTGTTGGSKQGGTSPGKVKVAVLNGTAVPGLAAKFGDDVRSVGFKLGPVTNSESGFPTSVVMYKLGSQPEADKVAKELGIQDVELMTPAIEKTSKDAEVAVIVGEDRAPAGAAVPGGAPDLTTPAPVTPTPTPTP